MWHKTYSICDAYFWEGRARGSFAPLQKSHRNHWSYVWLVWTKAFSSTVLCSPARTVWIALGCYFAKYTLLFTFFEGTHYCVSIACNGASVPVVTELRLPSLSLGEICPIYQFELCLSAFVSSCSGWKLILICHQPALFQNLVWFSAFNANFVSCKSSR